MREKKGKGISTSPSSGISTLDAFFLYSFFFLPHLRDKPGALFYLTTGEIGVISITQPYSGALDDCSSSSSSPPHYTQKIPKNITFVGWQLKEIPALRKHVNSVRLRAWLMVSNKESCLGLYFTLFGNCKRNGVHLFQLLLAGNREINVFQGLGWSSSSSWL